MFKYLPIQAKIGFFVGVVVLFGVIYWIIRQQGYNACTAKYELLIAEQKEISRTEIIKIEGAYNDSIKKLHSIPTENNIAGPRTSFAINSLYPPNNSE